jgi:formyl transferase-like protein
MALNIVAITEGELDGFTLWQLNRIRGAGHDVTVVRSKGIRRISQWRRFRALARGYGFLHPVSRRLGFVLFGSRAARRARRLQDYLFDRPYLQDWYEEANLPELHTPSLGHGPLCTAIAEVDPDVMIRITGGLLRREMFTLPKIMTLNLHHGCAPAIRGMSSLLWGIVEERPDWIGATIHEIDAGIDTGNVFWRGAPQLSAGTTAEALFFRITVEATQALLVVLQALELGGSPPVLRYDGESVYRTAPGLGTWIRFHWLKKQGRNSRVLLDKALN